MPGEAECPTDPIVVDDISDRKDFFSYCTVLVASVVSHSQCIVSISCWFNKSQSRAKCISYNLSTVSFYAKFRIMGQKNESL